MCSLGLLLATSYVAWSSHRQRREAELESTKQRNEVREMGSAIVITRNHNFLFVCVGGDDR